MAVAYAVLASLLNATYDGGEWIPGFVIVLSTGDTRNTDTFLSNKKQKKSSTRRQKTKVNTGVKSKQTNI